MKAIDLTETPPLLTVDEVAKLLRRSVRTIRHWRDKGLIRVIQPNGGGRLLVPRDEVRRLLDEAEGL